MVQLIHDAVEMMAEIQVVGIAQRIYNPLRPTSRLEPLDDGNFFVCLRSKAVDHYLAHPKFAKVPVVARARVFPLVRAGRAGPGAARRTRFRRQVHFRDLVEKVLDLRQRGILHRIWPPQAMQPRQRRNAF